MIKKHSDGGVTITGEHIELYRLIHMRKALQLEVKGLKFGRSVSAMVKKEFGFKGNKQKVLEQFDKYIKDTWGENA